MATSIRGAKRQRRAHSLTLGAAAAALLLLVCARPVRSQEHDSSAVAAVITAYHASIARGDSTAALALLAPDAAIVESGGVETREEFRARHLPADMAFAQAVKAERGPVRVVVQGDVAWATSTSLTQGEYRGRQINSTSAELMVLSRTAAGWRIRAIHWSSRPRRG